MLAETARRITALAAWASQQQHPATGQAQQQHATGSVIAVGSSRRLVPSNSLGSRPTPAVQTAGGSRTGAVGVFGVVLEHCSSLLTWCREAEARIAR